MERKSLIALFIFTLMGITLSAQMRDSLTTATDTSRFEPVEIKDFLPPLGLIIDSALANAPQLEYFDNMVEASEYDVILERKAWSKDLAANVGYSWSYGNQVLDNNLGFLDEKQERTSTFTSVSLNLPFSTWYTRSERIKKAEAMRKTQVARYEQTERDIREQVIELYSRLLLLQELLAVVAEARETSNLIMETAEQRFRDGEIGLEELGQATDLKAQYGTQYAELKTEFSTIYQALERIAGVPFSKFKTESYIKR